MSKCQFALLLYFNKSLIWTVLTKNFDVYGYDSRKVLLHDVRASCEYIVCVKRRNVESVVITQKKSESSQRESNP